MKKALISMILMTLFVGAKADEGLCLTTVKTAHTAYLDTLRTSILEKKPSLRKSEAKKQFLDYAQIEKEILERHIAQKKSKGTLGKNEQEVLSLYRDLSLIQYQFFACELIRDPAVKRGDLIDRGMNFCRALVKTSKTTGSDCLE